MTTIVLRERTDGNGGKYQVFGSYSGPDDRYVFGVRSFDRKDAAEAHAAGMMDRFGADHFERIK